MSFTYKVNIMGSNNKKFTTEEFIEKARKVHGEKFDYSLVKYFNNHTKVKIICSIHGVFEQTPGNHLLGQSCIYCRGKVKSSSKEFIEKARKVHGEKFDYSLVDYINCKTKIKIICKEHGMFEQNANNHLQGKGCPLCGGKTKRKTETFIEEAKEINGNIFDYSLVDYINCKTKIKIICNNCHGIFEQNPNNHLRKRGCPLCRGLYKTTEMFVNEAKKVHGDKYDYSLTNYIKSETRVKIICPNHGLFKQIPYLHITGSGCPHCNSSKGETTIRNFLIKNNIAFEEQKKFEGCKNKISLPFDFYLPKYNICIEYQGIQHYKPIKHFGGIEAFNYQKKRDNIKKEYCRLNNIPLIEIAYNKKDLSIIKALLLENQG